MHGMFITGNNLIKTNNVNYNASVQRKFYDCRKIFSHQRRFNEASTILTIWNPKLASPLMEARHIFIGSLYLKSLGRAATDIF